MQRTRGVTRDWELGNRASRTLKTEMTRNPQQRLTMTGGRNIRKD